MNIVYLLGIVLAFVFVIFGITFDPGGTGGLMVGPFNLDTLINFVDPTSILIVLGGTLAVVVACYPKLAKSFPKHFKIMLRLDAFNPEQYVEKLTELAPTTRTGCATFWKMISSRPRSAIRRSSPCMNGAPTRPRPSV